MIVTNASRLPRVPKFPSTAKHSGYLLYVQRAEYLKSFTACPQGIFM